MTNDVTSLRLDSDLMQRVDLAAEVLQQTKTDFIRDAIKAHLDRISAETGFKEALDQHLDRYRRMLYPHNPETRGGTDE